MSEKRQQDPNRLSDHFTRSEMECPHCHELVIDQELLDKLEALRKRIGNRPINVNSGYRCKVYNKFPEVNGADNSQHLYGKAADIWVKGMDSAELLVHAHAVGFNGLFLYDRFVHVDTRSWLSSGDFRTKKGIIR